MERKTTTKQSLTHDSTFCFLYLSVDQLVELGISRSTINRKIKAGEWKSRKVKAGCRNRWVREILASSLPLKLQLRWAQYKFLSEGVSISESLPTEVTEPPIEGMEKKLSTALIRIPSEERISWLTEALRLSGIVTRYLAIKVKRQRNSETGSTEFVPEVYALCNEAACTNPQILAREPHRAAIPSPHTLYGWSRLYEKFGLLTFFRYNKSDQPISANKIDKRRVDLSLAAVEWINSNWQKFSSSRQLYEDFKRQATQRHWKIPSESWFFRRWRDVPAIVKVLRLEGQKAYESKLAPYVPRDYSDLKALQVLCGDHSERDITVSLPNGTITRPWLTIWYDLRTGLIWGWHLSLTPSSYTAGLAYADGVRNFGAQPFSRPSDGIFSFIYTDRGRDYRSHNWDGKVIIIHKEAMRPEGGFKALLVQQRVGIVDELSLKHLITRGHNPRENPVERIHGIISEWERNTFNEYCGRSPAHRPDHWRKLYSEYQQFKRGKRERCPFVSFDQYREKLAEFISRFNTTAHIRTTLGGIQVIPLEEFNRLYTTRYEIDSGTLAIILMKSTKRRIKRNGVELFQKNWFYLNEAMLPFIGADVEVRYSDGDYNTVTVILPNNHICEAERITPSSIINPNKQTLKTIAKARAHERRINEEFHFIALSCMRGETLEDRVANGLKLSEPFSEEQEEQRHTATVHLMTRTSNRKLHHISGQHSITASDVANAEGEEPLLVAPTSKQISEFDDDN